MEFVVGKLSFERAILMDIGQDSDCGANLLGNCVRVSRNWEGVAATETPPGIRVSHRCEGTRGLKESLGTANYRLLLLVLLLVLVLETIVSMFVSSRRTRTSRRGGT